MVWVNEGNATKLAPLFYFSSQLSLIQLVSTRYDEQSVIYFHLNQQNLKRKYSPFKAWCPLNPINASVTVSQSIDLLCRSIEWFLYEINSGTYGLSNENSIFDHTFVKLSRTSLNSVFGFFLEFCSRGLKHCITDQQITIKSCDEINSVIQRFFCIDKVVWAPTY